MILFSWLTKNSRVGGGQEGVFMASARILFRCSKSSYGQMWTHLLSPPTSVYMAAAKGENSSLAGTASAQMSTTLPMLPVL